MVDLPPTKPAPGDWERMGIYEHFVPLGLSPAPQERNVRAVAD